MVTYASADAAKADGAFVTHKGSCGLCSTATDLAAYLAAPDLTSAGKKCGMKALASFNWGVSCFEDLGFTKPCSQIWTRDALATSSSCGWTCMKMLLTPNNGPPPMCSLNKCIQCDEDESGPLFKQIAARTRRRSGLVSAIVRPCSSVYQIEHVVCPLKDAKSFIQ